MPELAILGGPMFRSRPFAPWPPYGEHEREVLLRTLESRSWGGYPAPNTRARQFAQRFADYIGARHGICAANGSITLEVALRAAGLKAGDEVIVPALTWIATAACAVHLNMVPVIVDVDPETYCMDPAKAEEAITDRTRAIIPVHLGANIADMDRIMALAEKHGLTVIEDCAHAHGARWNGRGVGSIGHFGSFSFQSSKLMTAGEGGIILTNDDLLAEKCHSLVNCGRKEPDYCSFEGTLFGWNARISDLQAAVLLGQMEHLHEDTVRREQMLQYFIDRLSAEVPGLTPMKWDPRITTRTAYQLVMRYDPEAFGGVHRDIFLRALEAEGVELDGSFYVPLHDHPCFNVTAEEWPYIRGRYGDSIPNAGYDLPVAAKAAYHEAVWMHYHYFMGTREDLDDVIGAIRKVAANLDELREVR
jgi:dTDP-4-amino-4,6-dideoxygalactose transaminase